METLIEFAKAVYATDHIGVYLSIAVAFAYAMKRVNDWGKPSPFDMRTNTEEDPMFNVNGVPMVGLGMGAFSGSDFDMDEIVGSLQNGSLGPACNIDGTPMFGDIDANGHAFGVTD